MNDIIEQTNKEVKDNNQIHAKVDIINYKNYVIINKTEERNNRSNDVKNELMTTDQKKKKEDISEDTERTVHGN